MQAQTVFSEADLAEVEVAVHAAEAASAGEIVPCAVSRSDLYEAAAWKGAALGALLGAVAAAVVHRFAVPLVAPVPSWIIALPPLAGGVAGFAAAALIRPLTLWLTGRAAIDRRVDQRARLAFAEREVWNTRDRTGVLLFLSLFERRVVVLADAGISSRVAQREWDAIVAELIAGIRGGAPGKALAGAIRKCGELLVQRGVAVRADDSDELSDQLLVRND